jgi:penicillin-binding protein 2
MASAALQEEIITANTSFLSTGGLAIGQWFFPDWQAGGHGMTNVRKSIAWSVNTFYYMIGGGYGDFVGLGVRRMDEYLSKFGFGQKLGIDIPAEADGFLPTPEWKKETKGETWYVGDTYNFSIGQGDFLTTPLQIASMTATIANGGTLYKPHFAKSVEDEQYGDLTTFEPETIRSGFISATNIETVRLGMNDCVTGGSCWMLRNLPFSAAGKTGTAQWNRNKDTHAWYTSFAPFEHPEIVVTVLVEEGGEGSLSAQPIAADFYKWWGSYRIR